MAEIKAKVTLTKKGEEAYVSVKQLMAKLKWTAAVDLDLMAFYKAKDGRVGAVFSENYSGGSMGSLNSFPFIQLSEDAGADARSGEDEEVLRITKLEDLAEVYICTINFTEAMQNRQTSFSNYDAQVLLIDDKGESIAVPLDSPQSGTVAVIAKIDNAGFMGAKLVNENQIMDLATFQATIPGASSLQLLSKAALLEKKLEQQAPQILQLAKKATLAIKKANLTDHQAKVALCLDISASMGHLYKSGKIQRFAEKILALGCRFDDDGAIDIFLFGANAHSAGEMNVDNFANFIPKILKKYPLEGSTYYGKAMQGIRNFYFPDGKGEARKSPVASNIPVYVMFVTDGATFDEQITERQLKWSSYEPIFWQYMAIGKSRRDIKKGGLGGLVAKAFASNFTFLERLDEMRGRYLDNANFFSVEDPESISDDELYELLMSEYPTWVKLAQNKDLLRPIVWAPSSIS
ncbi:MAG: VWA domain-containing protein [Hormoscilla sp.]